MLSDEAVWHQMWRRSSPFDTKLSKIGSLGGSRMVVVVGRLLRLHQLHVGANGTRVFWSASQRQTALSRESQNLNNKCSGMTNCLESSQGQRRTIEAVSLVNTRHKSKKKASPDFKFRSLFISRGVTECVKDAGAVSNTPFLATTCRFVFFESIFYWYYL